jgi:glyceraldehyde-3-phosphate dehydrogenase (ferredoxin)
MTGPPIPQNVLYIDSASGTYSIKDVDDESIIGPVDFGFKSVEEDKSSFCFGSGVLAGSNIPGTRRLIFTGMSPLWEGFYISTMGGAAFVFHKLGLNYVCIRGKCEKRSVMEIKRLDGDITVSFHPIDVEKVWEDYKDETGIYALQQYVYDNYGEGFNACRILVTGPAALKTRVGAVASAPIVGGKITPVDCWAGRGGLGSKLVQQHNIAAIIYGGDFVDAPDAPVKNKVEIDKMFDEKFHKKMIQEDMAATVKYRYDPAFHSGGTLGVNYTKLKGWMFSFNYQSIYYSEDDRLTIHKQFVLEHYLKQFNEETIDKKQFKHCGEPCGALCKKMNGIYKKDYEPYQTMGPNSGIFDQRAAEKINHYADAMGFDAIQVGSLISWIMECILKKKFPKEDFDIDMEPSWDWKNFDIIKDSHNNADMGCQIIDRILNSDKCAIFREGIRNAAKTLDKRYGTDTINLAVFNSFAEEGCMVPNQYWVPGMFSPMPIMGKYFEHYGADYLDPYELGKKNAERMIKELYCDNTGICRFHRAWVEALIDDLIDHLFNVKVDYYAQHRKLAQAINMGNKSVFWESERVIDIIKGYLEKVLTGEPENKELKSWVDRFNSDKFATAKDYWQKILNGINDAFSD